MRLRSLVVLLLLLDACASTAGSNQNFDQPIVVRMGQTAEFPDGLRVTFTRLVSDSRCPVNVQCIQAGEAVVELTCSRDHESMPVRLGTARTSNRADVYGDRIELLKVDPAPVAPPRAPSDYTVTIRVTPASAANR